MNRQLYLAHTSAPDVNVMGKMLNMLFVAYAPTQQDAEAAIRDEVGDLATIEFREHSLPVSETVDRLGLRDGRARSLA